MTMTSGQYLRQKRESLGLSQDKLAYLLGYASGVTIQQMEADRKPIPPHKVETFAKALGVDPIALLDLLPDDDRYHVIREKVNQAQDSKKWDSNVRIIEPEGEIRRIPVYSINAGWRSLHEPLGIIAVPANMGWPRDVVCCIIEGDSMAPTVRNGDLVVAALDIEWRSGDACMVSKGNDGDPDQLWTLKRVYRTKQNIIRLVPDNPEYETVELTEEDLETFAAFPIVAVQLRWKGLRKDR